jgi:hypothetical protein
LYRIFRGLIFNPENTEKPREHLPSEFAFPDHIQVAWLGSSLHILGGRYPNGNAEGEAAIVSGAADGPACPPRLRPLGFLVGRAVLGRWQRPWANPGFGVFARQIDQQPSLRHVQLRPFGDVNDYDCGTGWQRSGIIKLPLLTLHRQVV